MNPSAASDDPVLQLTDASVVKNGVRVLDGLTLTIRAGEHTAILGPNGAGKTALINLLISDHYALAREGDAPVRVFGSDRWNVAELQARLGIVTSDLHQRFVNGNCTGSIRGEDAVLSGFFATRGFLIGRGRHRRHAAAGGRSRSRVSTRRTSPTNRSIRCRPERRDGC